MNYRFGFNGNQFMTLSLGFYFNNAETLELLKHLSMDRFVSEPLINFNIHNSSLIQTNGEFKEAFKFSVDSYIESRSTF